ncbi:hypothetical protein LRAMOSA02948 [Lichtheimia ramosa]|uniref:Magnesium-dependent phosphatase-1 n=1 Tax=Lichtheimia ramosa TaxID=688394 RepID=A0A077WUC4_9FUNG|nr:hypothetical protein LRAMOSA02948 [Lichtheimia ramosa]
MTRTQQLPERHPKLIVFDLDYTLWEEWIDCTSGPPFSYDKTKNVIYDRNGSEIHLFKAITSIFALIHNSMPNTKIAIASRTHTPEWAYAALKLLRIPELKMTMHAAIERFEIYPSSKIRHFEALRRKTGIECSDMIFFDDEWRNNEVRTLGVHFHHVDSRKGVTMQQFMDALSKYDRDSRYIQTKLDFSKH